MSFDRRDDNNHDDRRRREIHFHRTTVACRARHRFETPRESVIGQVGLRWIGEKERRGKETGKERGRGGGRGRERRKKAWRLSKFKLPVSQPRHERERGPRLRRRNSTEPREPLAKHVPWCGTGDRGRSQVQNPCASTSQGLGFGVTFAGIFVSTSDFTSFRCLCYMLYLENRQGSRESRFLLEAFERYDIYICCIYQANIYDEHSREYISCVGSYPHHSANSP